MSKIEHKFFADTLDLKNIQETGEFAGYVAVYNNIDQGGDIIDGNAFIDSLASYQASGTMPKLLWQHDPSQPIGVWTSLKTDERGLYGTGRLLLEVAKAKEAYVLIKAGALDGISIGYKTLDFDIDNRGNRLLKKLLLMEASLVTFPMNPSATVNSVKSLSSIREVERILRDAGVPNAFAKLVATSGFDEAKNILEGQQREAESEQDFTKGAKALLNRIQKLQEKFNG
jgi:HK97 family phage prohead protease